MTDFTCQDLASSQEELNRIIRSLLGFYRLPFASDSIPGQYVEATIAAVRDADILKTYDFADVVDRRKRIAWQIKSTKADTPVTWMRAKIPNRAELIAASRGNAATAGAAQQLGDRIISYANEHAQASMRRYKLKAIGYARVVVTKGELVYFERELVTEGQPNLFDPGDFEWHWSVEKRRSRKEQLSALHGTQRRSGEKWFAWHGQGENQLHFYGERSWWPATEASHSIIRPIPDKRTRMSFAALEDLLTKVEIGVEEGDVPLGESNEQGVVEEAGL